ncbi:MAG: DUF4258 domain-containing protein [Schwartzia sp.]|nr:DUF4258 domain-containing protein [Schwartzia sp. (in: firmicutes)]
MSLEEIQSLCRQGKIQWTNHVQQRMAQRNLTRQDVKTALLTGAIIEDYPKDYPFPSCLVLGGNRLHVVCGIGDGVLWIITAYRPAADKWAPDLKTRKET